VISGLYVLRLELLDAVAFRVGALGRFELAAGWYLYTGSAQRNLQQRVQRHLAGPAVRRWHIDYLTTSPWVRPRGAVLVGPGSECWLNRAIGRLAPHAPVPGFGASDCRHGCPAHLWYAPERVPLATIAGLRRRSRVLRG
jgi:Uri superfamily endonuclease